MKSQLCQNNQKKIKNNNKKERNKKRHHISAPYDIYATHTGIIEIFHCYCDILLFHCIMCSLLVAQPRDQHCKHNIINIHVNWNPSAYCDTINLFSFIDPDL